MNPFQNLFCLHSGTLRGPFSFQQRVIKYAFFTIRTNFMNLQHQIVTVVKTGCIYLISQAILFIDNVQKLPPCLVLP